MTYAQDAADSELDENTQAMLALEEFRTQRWGGEFSFKFELKHMPRRGDTSLYSGQLWAKWNIKRPLTRIEVYGLPGQGIPSVKLLVENGPDPQAWSTGTGASPQVEILSDADLFTPLMPGVTVTPFDLQMPFIYWDHYEFEGTARKRGRLTYTYLMHAPEDIRALNQELATVRIFLDAKLKELVQAEALDAEGNPLKAFNILSFKKSQGVMFPKTIDFLDEQSRDKTRMRVIAAAFDRNLPDTLFVPSLLNEEAEPLPFEAYNFF